MGAKERDSGQERRGEEAKINAEQGIARETNGKTREGRRINERNHGGDE